MMLNKFNLLLIIAVVIFLLIVTLSCDDKGSTVIVDENYFDEIFKERMHKDSIMVDDPNSPFKRGEGTEFSPLKYYDPDPGFIFESKLYKYETPDTVFVLGTKGEYRVAIIEGYLSFKYSSKEYRINVYKSHTRTGEFYHSIWFTDKTTGYETYGVGRYIDFILEDDPEYIYTLDFNKAYNPYCAYNSLYTCPIPREEDYIDLAITAGEKNFH